MLPLIISIISIFVVAGVATTVYVQAAQQRDLYNKRLAEVVGKTNNANQYEFEKNKDQEVSLDRVRGDIVKYDGQISGLQKKYENVQSEYGGRIGDLSVNVANMNQQVSKTLGQVNQLTESQTEKIANLGGKVRENSTSISQLNDKMAVVDGKLVNINQQNSVVQRLVTEAETMRYEQGQMKNLVSEVQNKSATDIANQNTSIANLQTSTTNRLGMQDGEIQKVYNVAKSVQNLVTTLDTAIENVRMKFGDYFTKTDVNTKFASKQDLAAVNSSFGNYLTLTDFDQFKYGLPDFPTRGEMEVMLNSFLTQKDITQLSNTLTDAQMAINGINQSINYIKSQYVTSEQIMKVTGELSGTVNIQGLYLTLQGLQTSLQTLSGTVTDINNSLTTFKSDVARDYATKVALQNQFDVLAGRIDALKTQAISLMNVTISGGLTVSGTTVINDIAFSKGDYSKYPDTTGQINKSEISNDTNAYKKLMLVGNKSAGGADREVGVWDNLTVDKNATVKGKMSGLNVESTGAFMMGADGSKGWFKSDGSGYVSGNFGVGVAPTDVAFNNGATTGTKQMVARGGTASDWQAQFINPNGNRSISMNHGTGNGMQINTNDSTATKYALQTTNSTTGNKTFEVMNDSTVNTYGTLNVRDAAGAVKASITNTGAITGTGAGVTNLSGANIATGVVGVGVGGTGLVNPLAGKVLVGAGTAAVTVPLNLHWDATNTRLGVGNAAPTTTLDVTGAIKASGLNLTGPQTIAGNNYVEFGSGVAGKEPNAGRIGYQTYTSGALDIVGAGTAAPRKIKLWDDVDIPNNLNVARTITASTYNGLPVASTTVPGIVTLSDSATTASSTVAATLNAVQTANDNANTRVLKSGDTMTGTLNVPTLNGTNNVCVQNTCLSSTEYQTLKSMLTGQNFVPKGTIVMWSGATTAIPSGWSLCDGANGTPDLRNRFVVGAGSTYAVTNTGGASTVTLTTTNLPAHSHTGTTSLNGKHVHTTNATDDGGRNDGTTAQGGQTYLQTGFNTNEGGEHSHTFTTDTTGSGSSFYILPPYYALAYIMKL